MFKNNKSFSSFSVNDIQKARGFYSGILGLEISDTGMPGVINLHLAGCGDTIIYSKPNHTPATFTVLNFYVKNVEEAVKELMKREVRIEKYNDENIKTDYMGIFRSDGIKCAWFNDPAGNILCVMEEWKTK